MKKFRAGFKDFNFSANGNDELWRKNAVEDGRSGLNDLPIGTLPDLENDLRGAYTAFLLELFTA